ncbi:MAG: ribokinase [Bacillota bacterium]
MSQKIVILGSFVVDLMGRAPHLPVPGESVRGSMFKMGPGGKGSNQCVAAKRSGGDVVMITKVGDDDFGRVGLSNFKNEGIDSKYIYVNPESTTATALILVDEVTGQNQILVNLGACETLQKAEIESASEEIKAASIFLTQLETNIESIEMAIDIAFNSGVKIVLNPAPIQPIPDHILKKVYILTPNEVEASILTGIDIVTTEDARAAAHILLNKGVSNVIITLGSKGSLVVTPESERVIPCLNVKALDTTGAGDAYNGGLVTALAEGKDIMKAAEFANIVASLSVTKLGTALSMPYRKEIDEARR